MNLTWLYVGALYAAGVWFARRSGFDLPRRIALLFFALVFVFLIRPLTQQSVIVAADVVKLTQPWSEVRPPDRPPLTKYEVSNLNLADVTMQIVPWMHQVRESWRTGRVPLWNGAAGCGYPLLANGQSTPLSPLQILTIPLPLAYAVTAESAMKILLALLLTYLFCRTRYSRMGSLLAAIAYGFSSWTITWLQFPIAAASAFLPGVLLAIDRLAEGYTRRRFVGATLFFAATVLSGHPESVFHVGLIAAGFGLWVVRSARALLPVAGASLVAAMISSPFLVAFAEAVVRSQRLAETRIAPDMTAPPYSDFHSAILLLQPRFFGELPIERPWGPTVAESICGFAGVLSLVAVVAGAITVVRRRRWRDPEAFYVLGALLCLGVVLGWPLVTPVIDAIAGFSPLNRLRMGICFFASILIAPVFDWSRRDRPLPVLAGALAVAAAMWWVLDAVAFPAPSYRTTAVLSLLPSVAVLAALSIPRAGFHLAGVLTILELWLAMGSWNPVLPARELYPRTPLIAALERIRGDARIVGLGGQIFPNTGAMFGFEDVRIHDPMASSRYVGFLTRTIGWNSRDYYAKWNAPDTPLLDYLNVRYVVTEPSRELPAPLVYAGTDGRIYENPDVLPRFFAVRNLIVGDDVGRHSDWRYTALVRRIPDTDLALPWDTDDALVEVERLASDRYVLRIDTPRKTLIVSSIVRYPGWRAGTFPTLDVNGPFLGFVVPAGRHEVEVAYRPRSFLIASVIAALTLTALLGIPLVETLRTRFSKAPHAFTLS